MEKKAKLKTVGIRPEAWEKLKLMAISQRVTLAELISQMADELESRKKDAGNGNGTDGNGKAE